MGFYSIYKIIKDIFRTIFGNKALKLIFIILIFVLIIMFFNNKGVFAFTGDFDYSGEDNEILLNNMHYVVDYVKQLKGNDLDLDKYVVFYNSDHRFDLMLFNKNNSTLYTGNNNLIKSRNTIGFYVYADAPHPRLWF